MKKGYKKLLILELILFLILGINSFSYNFLTGYKMIFFLFIVLGVFKLLLGFEKDRHRYIKDFILDETVMLIVFLLIYYFIGVFIGFVKTDYSFNIIRRIIIPSVLYIVLREYVRYLFLTKGDGNKLVTILAFFLIVGLDITNNIYLTTFDTKYSAFIFASTILMPAIFSNIAYSYVTKKVGYKPVLYFCLVMELYGYIFPITPDGGQYLNTIILLVVPTILCIRVNNILESLNNQKITREDVKKKRPYLSLVLSSITVFILVYFTSGNFDKWAVVVASNSMAGSLSKGDIVIIDKVNNDYNKIEEGKIIAYKYNDKIIIHRVVEAIHIDNRYYFKTKGDANNNPDEVLVSEKMVIGIIDVKIPYVGLPTIWLKNL